MAENISTWAANAFLNAVFNNVSFAVPQVYIQLHVGPPGAAGTNSVAAETTRKPVSMAAAVGPSITNDAQVQYTGIAGSQDASHYSLWDSATPGTGNFIGSGVISAFAYTAGDTLTFAVGDIDITMLVAS